ncbi:hypothetical protein EC973_002996 [Apophysomyces ossiformis]|uniref:Uncharacterized protein n=1 Tax=Apophysomyces ossiformis TaxID=679940 RepID=A0A8H7EV08_9FUNG|nr:hypothetical protein EC973_002996 [Apophysomyces ossiformis]
MTIWTLASFDAPNGIESQEKMASRLFQTIARLVIIHGSNARLEKAKVIDLLYDCPGSLMQHVKQIHKLFDDVNSLSIIGNAELNSVLTKMAALLANALRTENVKVREKLIMTLRC